MQIGVNPLIWTNDDEPALGADVPLERCLAEAREAGYAGIELGHKFPRAARELRPMLLRHDLALVSGWYSGRLLERGAARELEEMRDHVELLHAMRCSTLIFGDVTGAVHRDARPLSARPTLDAAEWSRFTRELDVLARALSREGIHLAYHHHVGTFVETPDEITRLLEGTSDAVGLLLDTGHLAFAGAAPLDHFVERWVRRIRHVHLKDVRAPVLAEARATAASFLDAVRDGVFTVPGDGDLDLAPVIGALRRGGYSGWVVVEAEQDPAIADPLTYAKLGFANTERLLAHRSAPPPGAFPRLRRARRTPRLERARRERGLRARAR